MLHTETDLDKLTAQSIDTVRRWLRVSTSMTTAKNPAAERLSAVLSDDKGDRKSTRLNSSHNA